MVQDFIVIEWILVCQETVAQIILFLRIVTRVALRIDLKYQG